MKSLRLLVLLAVFSALAPSQAAAITIQAEDYLWCPGIKPSEANRKALARIVEERYALARGITLASMPIAMTFFGLRIDEPAEVLAWRDKEDVRVRALIAPSEMEMVRKFALSVRDQTSKIDRKFPLSQSINLSMTQSVYVADGEKMLKVDLVVPADSADYKMQYQAEMNSEGALVIHLTRIRPSFYELLGREPEAAQLKTTITRKGPLPKTIEVWTRTIDEDLPLNLKFKRVGTAEVEGS